MNKLFKLIKKLKLKIRIYGLPIFPGVRLRTIFARHWLDQPMRYDRLGMPFKGKWWNQGHMVSGCFWGISYAISVSYGRKLDYSDYLEQRTQVAAMDDFDRGIASDKEGVA